MQFHLQSSVLPVFFIAAVLFYSQDSVSIASLRIIFLFNLDYRQVYEQLINPAGIQRGFSCQPMSKEWHNIVIKRLRIQTIRIRSFIILNSKKGSMRFKTRNRQRDNDGGGGGTAHRPLSKLALAATAAALMLGTKLVSAGDPIILPALDGIGYYEMSASQGVNGASLAGGTEIVIFGHGMSHTPSSLTAIFSNNLMGTNSGGPPRPQDVAFSSHTDGGKLKYTTPSIMGIHNAKYEDFGDLDYVTYDLSMLDYDASTQQVKNLKCRSPALPQYCQITYSRYYTPILHYLSPPVIYSGSEMAFFIDTRAAQEKRSTQLPELPWSEVRLNGFGVDFEGFIEEDVNLPAWQKIQVRGTMGAITPSNNVSVEFRFRVGYAMHMDHSMIRCSYDNSTCYKAKAVAKIDSIETQQGYTTGGQILTVNGHGFGGDLLDVKIDGVPCTVIENDLQQFKCLTGANPNPTNLTSYPGQHGLRRKYYNSTTQLSLSNILRSTQFEETLSLDLEALKDINGWYSGYIYSGYFKAPATARYRFYISCDDEAEVYFSSVNGSPQDKTLIYRSPFVTSYRGYLRVDGRTKTEWLNLTQGEYYYLEVRMIQYTGGDHLSVAVEIEDPTITPGHFHTMREIQRLFVDQVITRETTNVTIENVDAGLFTLTFIDPKTGKNYISGKMSTDCSSWQMHVNIRDFYSKVYSAGISVSKTLYDADGIETVDSRNFSMAVYSIKVQRSLNSASTNQITIQKISTSSKITVILPKDIQLSNPIMTGAFRIKCALDKEGNAWGTTQDIGTTNYTGQIMTAIIKACPNYREKIEIWDGGVYPNYQDGRDIVIRFVGLNYDIPQMEVLDSLENPVKGDQASVNQTTWIPWNPSRIFYEPVPFEFLHTEESSPQVIVSIDGVEAVCHSLDCDYNYIQPASQITNVVLDGNKLSITGTNFTTNIKKIEFSHVECGDIWVIEESKISCTIVPVSGSWLPIVTDEFGIIPIDPSVAAIQVSFTVSGVSPDTDLNPYGGTFLSIRGTGLPQSLSEGSTCTVTFSDGSNCEIVALSGTKLLCMTQGFLAGTSSASVTVTVNGASLTYETVLTVMTDPTSVSSIIPNSVSPVLKTPVKIIVTDYSFTLAKEDLEVSIVSTGVTPQIVRPLNILEVGTEGDDQYIKAMFGGSESGVYDLKVRSRSYGKFDSTGITLTLVGKITDFNPKEGSIHGGSLITIDGYHFSTDYQNNPVRIGRTDCLVEVSTPTQIKCRTVARHEDDIGTDEVIVFLRTYEEAVCADEVTLCKFKWTNDAQITQYSTVFDETENHYVLKFVGLNLGDNLDQTNVEVFIDGFKQEVITASSQFINVRIISVNSETTSDIEIFLPSGHPGSDTTQLATVGITLDPRLHGINPKVGSLGGTMIFAEVRGIGVNSTGRVTLTNSLGADICQLVYSLPRQGQLLCLTKENLAFDIIDSLKLKFGSNLFDCSGVTGACDYQTSTVENMPLVTAVSKLDGLNLQLVGTGFQLLPDFTPRVRFLDIYASFVSIESDTTVIATFSKGVPVSNVTQRAFLYYVQDRTGVEHYAQNTNFTNAATVIELDSDVSCSFAGGCSITVSQEGLLANMLIDYQQNKNTLRVCGKLCEPDLSASTASKVRFTVPALPTTASLAQFNIVSESYLFGVPFSSIPSDVQATQSVWDGSHQKGWTGMHYPCYFGTAFRVGYVGVLNEVKYFMSRFDKTKFEGKLRFEASMTGSTGSWTTIFTVGKEIHEGWNYYNLPTGKELKYRYYRFYGTGWGSCVVGEVSLRGYEVIDSTNQTFNCQAALTVDGVTPPINLAKTISYQADLTPLLKSIFPRFGSVVGGELITFNGINFSGNVADYTVLIDDRACEVEHAGTDYFTCRTSPRPGLFPNPSLEIRIANMGNVATQGLIFRYVNRWSEPKTWGGDFAPVDGDLISIPKGLHLLVDIDSTPILSAVVVEGSLIFPSNANPNHLRTFDAHYVMVRGGLLEVGTEQFPYTSKLVITMHSNRSSPEIPIFGNKVIAMYNGVLDLHGIPRNPTWTELDVTADIGSIHLILIRDVDWQVGESIVIAPTGYFNTEAEERIITRVDNTNPQKPMITIDRPLKFKHYAGIQRFGPLGADWIETRAEVGLLTRNVLYRGDPKTSAKNEYGAQIMVHSNGMENLVARIEYIQLFNVGQAFQLGRYPIHFHLIGVVHNSYIKGNAIHQSFNRACTIHGVHYLRITQNVAYNIKGHTFFIEDAAETKNYLENNLAILTKKSWSLLNSDQTPASFWITHPDNIFRGNHAAGADNYGYWFDTKPFPTGPSFDPNVCPENSPLGEFSNNVAHSNGRYGLRIFHKLIPRTFPCMDIMDDPKNLTDRYWQNPLIPAVFTNFTSFKNRRNGAIALDIGAVRFENFKVSDNLLAGIEVELTNNLADGYARVDGALVIGYSELAEELTFTNGLLERPSYGIIGPRTEGFQVHNAKFYNFDKADKAAIGTCSHCFSSPSTDSGGRTLTVKNLQFDASTTLRVRYQVPFREIILDLDGSLTGLGARSWATAYWKHNEVPECKVDMAMYNGLICNPTVQVRRIVYHNQVPDYIFKAMEMKVIRIDDEIVGKMNNVSYANYLLDLSQYSVFEFRAKVDPFNAWAIPVVTGHKYKVHWQNGLDFTQMQVTLSPHWAPLDKTVYIVHNFTDVRAKVDFVTPLKDIVPNMTLVNKTSANWQMGDNVLYNQTERREIHYAINGKNESRKFIVMKGARCIGSCLAAVAQVVIETTEKLWSLPTTWPNGQVPVAGDDVEIAPGKNIIYDLEDSPIFKYVQINGRLTFKQDAPKLHLRAKYIFVRMGELIIGNETDPFQGEAKITLYGLKEDQHIVYDNAIEAGNKVLANTGLIKIYGKPRAIRSRLLKTAQAKDSTILVEKDLDWLPNDVIGLAPTTMKWFEKDLVQIKTYDKITGEITLVEPLAFYHWGAEESTAAFYSGIDMRGEVMLMSHNVKIVGDDTDSWGCQVVTSDFTEANNELRVGRTFIDNVEIYNCSQYDTWKAALRFQGTKVGYSRVSNSSIYSGLGIGLEIMYAENVEIINNNFWEFLKYGINIVTSNNITIDGNWVMGVQWREVQAAAVGDPTAGIVGCGHIEGDRCIGLKIINNVVAAVEKSDVDTTGYTVQNYQCGKPNSNSFYDNIAHSIHGYGAIIFRNQSLADHDQCIQASRFAAYKCQKAGIISNQATQNLVFQDMVLIDNANSAVGMIGVQGTNQSVIFRNIKFYGETEASECPGQPNICLKKQQPGCIERSAVMPSSYTGHNKPALITKPPSWPHYKIKADASFGGTTTYENLEFINFKSGQTTCGVKQRLFSLNPFNADYYPPVRLINSKITNVHQDALAYLMSPQPEWANIDDCGQFPCTGPNNVLIQFQKTQYSGDITPTRVEPNFQIISGHDENSGTFKHCTKVEQWNGYYCLNEDLAILLFESLDEDKLTRLMTPITITNEELKSRNVLNTFMDHLWDGFYTSMKRLSRFPALIQAGSGRVWDIDYKGTPPLRQKFTLKSNEAATTIRIKYPKAGTYIIKDANDKEIIANGWDNNIKAPALIRGDRGGYCGENRYVGVVNILEFYLTKGCSIFIHPIDSIQASVRMNWTMNQFFADGGTTKFVDRLAASLGIKVANVKIVTVFEGSVIVDFQVIEDTQKTLSSKGGIDKVKNVLTTKLTQKAINLGAPILNVQVSTTKATDTTATAAATTASSTTQKVNVYNPTNPIVQDAPKEQAPIIVLPPSKDKPIVQAIYNSTTVDVVRREEASRQNVVMIAVIATIIGVIVIGGVVGYFLYRRYQINLIATKSQGPHLPDQSSHGKMGQESPGFIGDDVFEEQYHPQGVVDIFGRGNDIIKKGNEADAIEEGIKEDFDEDQSSDRPDEDNLSSGAPESVGRTGSGGSNNLTTRNLVTNARESTLHENAPLSNFQSSQPSLNIKVTSRRGEHLSVHPDAAAYSSAQRQGASGRAPPTFNDEAGV